MVVQYKNDITKNKNNKTKQSIALRITHTIVLREILLDLFPLAVHFVLEEGQAA
jgi:hypothetical protein